MRIRRLCGCSGTKVTPGANWVSDHQTASGQLQQRPTHHATLVSERKRAAGERDWMKPGWTDADFLEEQRGGALPRLEGLVSAKWGCAFKPRSREVAMQEMLSTFSAVSRAHEKQRENCPRLVLRKTSQPRANPGSRSGCFDPKPPGFAGVSTNACMHGTDPQGHQWLNLVATWTTLTLFRSSTANSTTRYQQTRRTLGY